MTELYVLATILMVVLVGCVGIAIYWAFQDWREDQRQQDTVKGVRR